MNEKVHVIVWRQNHHSQQRRCYLFFIKGPLQTVSRTPTAPRPRARLSGRMHPSHAGAGYMCLFMEPLPASTLLAGIICKITAPLSLPPSLQLMTPHVRVSDDRHIINIQRKKTLVTILTYTTNNELNLLCGRQRVSIPN